MLSDTERKLEMEQLRQIDQEMEKDNARKHSGEGVYATMAWLKNKDDEVLRKECTEENPIKSDMH